MCFSKFFTSEYLLSQKLQCCFIFRWTRSTWTCDTKHTVINRETPKLHTQNLSNIFVTIESRQKENYSNFESCNKWKKYHQIPQWDSTLKSVYFSIFNWQWKIQKWKCDWLFDPLLNLIPKNKKGFICHTFIFRLRSKMWNGKTGNKVEFDFNIELVGFTRKWFCLRQQLQENIPQ